MKEWQGVADPVGGPASKAQGESAASPADNISSKAVEEDSKEAATLPVVLLVDDSSLLLEALRNALSRESFSVMTAKSGTRALAILATCPVDVVVSDERMAGMTGAMLMAKVHQLYPRTVRIILTGFVTARETEHALEQGRVFRFLAKPCPVGELVEVIRDGLRSISRPPDE